MVFSRVLADVGDLSLRDAAEHFARAGVPVFPCVPHEKQPRVKHGLLEATTNLSMVLEWWRRWPNANIGVPTGTVSGVDVVDVDVKGESPRGYDSFNRATDAGLLAGWDVRVLTPSGGLHVYFPADASRPQRLWQAARPQVDFRGDGGYVLAPPSRIIVDGQPVAYRVLDVSLSPIRPVDAQRLRDFLDPRPPAPDRRSWTQLDDVDVAQVATDVAGLREGERNAGLFKGALELARGGIAQNTALDVLIEAAGQAGLGWREARSTIRSAYRYVPASVPRRGHVADAFDASLDDAPPGTGRGPL